MRQLREELGAKDKALELARRTVERLSGEKAGLESAAAGAPRAVDWQGWHMCVDRRLARTEAGMCMQRLVTGQCKDCPGLHMPGSRCGTFLLCEASSLHTCAVPAGASRRHPGLRAQAGGAPDVCTARRGAGAALRAAQGAGAAGSWQAVLCGVLASHHTPTCQHHVTPD